MPTDMSRPVSLGELRDLTVALADGFALLARTFNHTVPSQNARMLEIVKQVRSAAAAMNETELVGHLDWAADNLAVRTDDTQPQN